MYSYEISAVCKFTGICGETTGTSVGVWFLNNVTEGQEGW